jgi:hypothetical protein
MTFSMPSDEAARRALVQRMQRYFDAVEREDRTLGPWETDRICKVLAYLETGYYRIGLEMMSEVELPDLHRTHKELAGVANGPILTVAEHRSNLGKVLAKNPS